MDTVLDTHLRLPSPVALFVLIFHLLFERFLSVVFDDVDVQQAEVTGFA